MTNPNCPKCNTPTVDDAKFCLQCGTEIPGASLCAGCGSPLVANAQSCEKCGRAAEAEQAPHPANKAAAVQQAAKQGASPKAKIVLLAAIAANVVGMLTAIFYLDSFQWTSSEAIVQECEDETNKKIETINKDIADLKRFSAIDVEQLERMTVYPFKGTSPGTSINTAGIEKYDGGLMESMYMRNQGGDAAKNMLKGYSSHNFSKQIVRAKEHDDAGKRTTRRLLTITSLAGLLSTGLLVFLLLWRSKSQ
jgi:hypothetical protein